MDWTREKKIRVANLIATTDKASLVSVLETEIGVSYSAIASMIKKIRRGSDEELKALFPIQDREVWKPEVLSEASKLWKQTDPVLAKGEIAKRFGFSRQALVGAMTRARESCDPEMRDLFPPRDKELTVAAILNRPDRPQARPKPERAKRKRKRPAKEKPLPVMPSKWKVTMKRPSNILAFPPPPVRRAETVDTPLCQWPMHGAIDQFGRPIFPAYQHDPRPGSSPLMCGDPRAVGTSYCTLHNAIAYSKDEAA